MRRTSVRLPFGLQNLVEIAAQGFLVPEGSEGVDFTRPPGEPALANPDSVCWQVFRNPVSLFIGGMTAVLMELAEPRVRAGVWNHTSFRERPVERLKRTGLAAMVTVYGAKSLAAPMIAGVTRAHGKVSGISDEGLPYRADDRELLVWVQATAAFGFLSAYAAYVRSVPRPARNLFFAEGEPAALLYGAVGAPTSEAEYDELLSAMAPQLAPSPVIFELLGILRSAPILPLGARMMQPVLIRAAVSLLPGWLRHRLDLGPRWSLRRGEQRLVQAAALAADRLNLASSPASQACIRLGLAPDYLIRRAGKWPA